MENENNTKQDCGCGGTDCCTPSKSKLWMKIVFIVVIAAAVTIAVLKLTGNCSMCGNKTTVTTEKSCGGADSTKKCGGDTTKVCDPQKKSSCCPGNN